MSAPVQAVTNRLQPPLSVGSRLTRRCAMVAKSIDTSLGFMPSRRSRSSLIWHIAALIGLSITPRITTGSPL